MVSHLFSYKLFFLHGHLILITEGWKVKSQWRIKLVLDFVCWLAHIWTKSRSLCYYKTFLLLFFPPFPLILANHFVLLVPHLGLHLVSFALFLLSVLPLSSTALFLTSHIFSLTVPFPSPIFSHFFRIPLQDKSNLTGQHLTQCQQHLAFVSCCVYCPGLLTFTLSVFPIHFFLSFTILYNALPSFLNYCNPYNTLCWLKKNIYIYISYERPHTF